MPRAIAVILFLMLTSGESFCETPLHVVGQVIFGTHLVKIPPWTIAQIALLVWLGGRGRSPLVRALPMDRALLVSIGCVAIWIALGVSRGAPLQDALFQVFRFCDSIVFAFVIMAVMWRPEHFTLLLSTIVAAAVARSLLVVYTYVFIVRDLPWD